MSEAFVALGSNLGNKVENLAEGARRLARGSTLLASSSLWRTEPIGDTDQDWFINQVLALETPLAPEELLHHCLDIEREMGRVRTRHWGPRLIDIDLLLYGDARIETADLTLPHPRMTERAFVLAPLAELAPTLRLKDRPIADLLAEVGTRAAGGYDLPSGVGGAIEFDDLVSVGHTGIVGRRA